MTVHFKVSLEQPEDVTIERLRDYIEDAVSTMCKSKDPENDPLFDLDGDTVKVFQIGIKKSNRKDYEDQDE